MVSVGTRRVLVRTARSCMSSRRRVVDFLKNQRVWRGQNRLCVPDSRHQALVHPVRASAPLPHHQGGTCQGTDHIVAESVRLDVEINDTIVVLFKVKALEGPHGGGPLPWLGKGSKVVQSQQRLQRPGS